MMIAGKPVLIQTAVLKRPGQPLEIDLLELDGPKDEEILVRIVATGVCHTDIGFCDNWNEADGPVVLGHEGAGIVQTVGRKVKGLQEGDHVVLSYQSCGMCSECRSARPWACHRFREANFGFALLDGTSALAAIVAKRRAIPVFHMEAGNRCYDDRVPEEVNRRIIDRSSDVLMPYTERSRANLLREGIAGDRIHVTGNPILEVIRHHEDAIGQSDVLGRLQIAKGGYFLVTMHREENVDIEDRLRSLTDALVRLQKEYGIPVICSLHPRTADRMKKYTESVANDQVRFLPPFGFFDFVHLEQNARCVISDSGTVQEECCIFHVPNVTIRDVMERPETIECGSNILSGADPETILRCVRVVLSQKSAWTVPPEYLVPNVSDVVARIVLGYIHPR